MMYNIHDKNLEFQELLSQYLTFLNGAVPPQTGLHIRKTKFNTLGAIALAYIYMSQICS